MHLDPTTGCTAYSTDLSIINILYLTLAGLDIHYTLYGLAVCPVVVMLSH